MLNQRSSARVLLLLLLLVGLAQPSLLTAPQSAPASAPPAPAQATKLPLDPAVQLRTLPNGLTFYVRHNERPDDRVLLRLAVKAGSIDEEDDQRGLAHFLEHMAFNGSAHFKPGDLVATFESIGARLGPHVNAYTSFEETVYMLQLPTDKEGLVRQGLVALSDFAGRLTLDPKEIDKERGVVIEEWRGGLGVQSRVRDKQIPILFYGSRYAQRLPIGDPEIIKSAPTARIRAFYEKWYRPDRMGVVVVGDVDPATIEKLIAETFGDLKNPPSPAPQRDYVIPLHDSVLVNVTTDPEMPRASVSMVLKHPAEPKDTVRDYRRRLTEGLVEHMINERLDELSRRKDARFLSASTYGSSLGDRVDTFNIAGAVPEDQIAEGLTSLAIEAKRVRLHGFGDPELDRAKAWTMAYYQRAFSERDKTESSSFANEYVTHFLENEPAPGIEYEYGLVQQFLPSIDLTETIDLARMRLETKSEAVLAVAPEKKDLTVPDETRLRAALEAADKVAVTPWVETSGSTTLLDEEPTPGTIVGRREVEKLGVTIVKFANGIEAWLKPTDFKNDQIVFTLYAPGGGSIVSPDDYFEAVLWPSLVELAGVGGHSALELQRLLAGKLIDASPFVSLSTHGISGSASPGDLQASLQLLYLTFIKPGSDAEAFALLKKQFLASVINRDKNPSAVFAEKVAEVNTSGHYTSRPLTVAEIEKLDPAAMTAFHAQAFKNPADFTFFMVGAFKVDEALPILSRYVGGLHGGTTAGLQYKQLGIEFPREIKKVVVEKGREPRSQALVSLFADPDPDENEQARLNAAIEVFEISLRDIIREELGQIYNVSVQHAQPLPQRGAGRVGVAFVASPDNVEGIVDRVLKEVARLQAEGPSEDLTNRAKETARREYETALRQNGYWLNRLQSAHLFRRDPLSILTFPARIDALTPAVLQQTFKQYFPVDRNTVVTLLPEKQ